MIALGYGTATEIGVLNGELKGEWSQVRDKAANQISRLMMELEKGLLREYTPCRFTVMSEIARAIAVVHTELLLIHPFLEFRKTRHRDIMDNYRLFTSALRYDRRPGLQAGNG
jgi:hypothetical protein